jgi:hypothetical protein
MTDTSATTAEPVDVSPHSPARAKSAPKSVLVKKLLNRSKGATLAELQTATAWQPHSVRAFLSGIRKKGDVLEKEPRKSGETAYRIAAPKKAARDA